MVVFLSAEFLLSLHLFKDLDCNRAMKVVVTGGAGFVGSHVSVLLWERGFDVVAVDRGRLV